MLNVALRKNSEKAPLPELDYQGEFEEEEVACADCGNNIVFEDEQFSLHEMVWHPKRKF
ncbi:MAG: hypothetical protein ACE5J7_04280 [Candidatus Aenigmatarchaeota archaeon]